VASNASIQAILGNNVVEIQFVRRHPKMGWSNIRGLFGTTNYELLNGDFGRQVLHFQPPKGVGMGYPYKNYNLCVVWDIFRQEYRVFGAEQVSITRQWDVTTEEGVEEFQDYMFNDIVNMRNQAKLDFMGYTGVTAAPAPPDKPVTVQKTAEPSEPKVPSKIENKLQGFYKRVGEWFKKRRRGK
jgi:hypothetical protein